MAGGGAPGRLVGIRAVMFKPLVPYRVPDCYADC